MSEVAKEALAQPPRHAIRINSAVWSRHAARVRHTQGSSTSGSDLFFGSGDSVVNYQPKAYGFTVRCLKD